MFGVSGLVEERRRGRGPMKESGQSLKERVLGKKEKISVKYHRDVK